MSESMKAEQVLILIWLLLGSKQLDIFELDFQER